MKREGGSGGLWRNPEFMKLWAGQTVSEFGSSMGALPLLAILVLHASPAQMGLLTAFGFAPVLLLGLFAGVWADRLRRRPLLIAADIGRFLALGSVPLAYMAGGLTLAQVYLVAAVMGALTVLFNVAYPSYLPSLVSRDRLVEGNGKLGVSSSVAEIAGTPLGYGIVQKIGAPLAVLVDALTFLASAAALGLIRKPEPPPKPSHERERVWNEIREGMGVVLGHKLLRPLVMAAAAQTFFGFFFATLYSLYALRTLGLPPALVGIVIGVGGVGSLFGATFSGPVTRRFGFGRTLVGTLVFEGVIGFLTPLASGPVWRAAVMLMIPQFFGDFALTIHGIAERSLRQSVLPVRVLGRANASIQFFVEGMGPMGALAGGLLGEWIGLRATLLIAVAGQLLAALCLLRSPLTELQAIPAPLPEPVLDLSE